MAHFSELSGSIFISEITGSGVLLSPPISGCYVSRTLVVSDDHEEDGAEFLSCSLELGGTWLKTSYNTRRGAHTKGGIPLRKNYADANFIYDYNRDAFMPRMPNPIGPPESGSWTLNEEQCWWYYVEATGSIASLEASGSNTGSSPT